MPLRLRLKSIFSRTTPDTEKARIPCAQPECENKLHARLISSGRPGISVGEQWYCSIDCFSLALHGILASLSSAEVVELPRHPRLSLGLALLTKGFLTTEQFQHATSKSEAEGIDIETTLVEMGWASEKQLAAARSAQWGYPVLGQDLSTHSVIADLPSILFRTYSATPLYYSGETKRLVLGFVERVDHRLLQSIEKITGCRAEPCFITPTQLARQLDRLTGPTRYQQVLLESPGTLAQMSQTLRDHATQIAATGAEFTRCHAFLWSRIEGHGGTVDLLFDLRNAAATFPVEYAPDIPEFNAGVRDRAFANRANRLR